VCVNDGYMGIGEVSSQLGCEVPDLMQCGGEGRIVVNEQGVIR